MNKSFSPDALRLMRHAIAEARGAEVFFLGRPDSGGRVAEVRVLARGNRQAVPAILQECVCGEAVIHNHPSGLLHPSDADLRIASILGAQGVAFFIVDNSLSAVYRVVELFAPRSPQAVTPDAIDAILGPRGAVARALPGFEERPEQLRMAFEVAEAFNEGRIAVIEAGTGTGKSLAYLIPSILWALRNEERVVVSTNTINLQEQLIRKDIPFLQRTCGLEFRAVLVKGRGNYFCPRRAKAAQAEPGLFEDEQAAQLRQILEWAAHSSVGSKDELPFVPKEQVWEEVRSEADQCGRAQCADFADCFFHKARRQAAQADVLVVNHALLMSDLAVRLQTENYSAGAVLPPFERIVLDEAHHLEDVATSYFSASTTRFSFARVLGRLRHLRKPERGLLPRLLAILSKEMPDSQEELYRRIHAQIEEQLLLRQALLEKSQKTLEDMGGELDALLGGRIARGEELRHRVLPAFTATPFWESCCERLRELALGCRKLSRALIDLMKLCERLDEQTEQKAASALIDLRSAATRLESLASDLFYFIAAEEGSCNWFEVGMQRQGRGQLLVTRLCSAPIEIGASLRKALFDRFRTVVMASATLSVDGRFDYFRSRTGLDGVEKGRYRELLLHSPFDYERQALVAIPTDLPDPGSRNFAAAARDWVERAVVLAGGRSFVLFTAYSLLRQIHAELAPVFCARGFHPLRQGEAGRHLLLKQFAEDPASVLFGTDSFWEGVDVPGRSLEQVIITRLPFKVPTEPVLEARTEAIEQAGGDPFMEFTVPQAVIKFRQGFGRLIRHREDRGVILILDGRVVKKGYGRLFLRSLPEVPVAAANSEEVFGRMERFFASSQRTPDGSPLQEVRKKD